MTPDADGEPRGLARELRLFAVALQFLTRLPVPPLPGWQPAWLTTSARHFPAVGLVVGAIGAAVLAGASSVWPPPVAALLSIAATLVATGGFHEDGLADTFDALAGRVPRERALEIMKDSRIGSYGALALVIVLGLKAAALAGLIATGLCTAVPALWLGHAASRAVAVQLLHRLPYAGDADRAKAKPMAGRATAATAAAAWGWVALAALAMVAVGGTGLLWPLAAGLAGAVAAGTLCGRWFRRRIGGQTGDTLGAAQQLAELALLLGWLAAVGPA